MRNFAILFMLISLLACSKKQGSETIKTDDSQNISNLGSDDSDNTNNSNNDDAKVIASNDSDDTSNTSATNTSSISSTMYVNDCSSLPESSSTSSITEMFFYIKDGEIADADKNEFGYVFGEAEIKLHKVCINFPALEKIELGEEKLYRANVYGEYFMEMKMKRLEDSSDWHGELLFVNGVSVIPGTPDINIITVDNAVMASIAGVLYEKDLDFDKAKHTENYEIKGEIDSFQILYELDHSKMGKD